MGAKADMMGDKPRVSVIMPAYNASAYISEAIEAVQAQTISDWELLIVDDCSSDNTLEIAEDYAAADPRIRILKSSRPSGGAYTPRKRGITEATAEFVAPLDADDYVEPDYLSRLLITMKDRNADAVYPLLYRLNGKEKHLISSPVEELITATLPGPQCVVHTIEGWHIHCGGGVIKREKYMQTFPLVSDSEIMSQQDELLTRILLYNCRQVAISDTPYFYRDNPGSITKKLDIRTFCFLINNSKLISFIGPRYGEDSEEYMKIQRQNFHGIFDAFRLLSKCDLSSSERKLVEKLIRRCRAVVDYKTLRGKVSWKYYALSKLPYGLLRSILTFL